MKPQEMFSSTLGANKIKIPFEDDKGLGLFGSGKNNKYPMPSPQSSCFINTFGQQQVLFFCQKMPIQFLISQNQNEITALVTVTGMPYN